MFQLLPRTDWCLLSILLFSSLSHTSYPSHLLPLLCVAEMSFDATFTLESGLLFILSSMLSDRDRAYLAVTKKEYIQNVAMFFTPRMAYETLEYVNLQIHLPLLRQQSAFCIVDCLVAMQPFDSLRMLVQKGIHLRNERFIVKLLLPLRDLSDASFFHGELFDVYPYNVQMNLLTCAAATNMSILVRTVVKLGGDVDANSFGKPPIIHAASCCSLDSTRELIRNGALVDKQMVGGSLTALGIAVFREYNKIAVELVKAGAKMESEIIRSVETFNRDASLAHIMLNHGAKVPDDCTWFKSVEDRRMHLRPRTK